MRTQPRPPRAPGRPGKCSPGRGGKGKGGKGKDRGRGGGGSLGQRPACRGCGKTTHEAKDCWVLRPHLDPKNKNKPLSRRQRAAAAKAAAAQQT